MDKKRAILVGCGSISRQWLAGVKHFDDLEIVGLADIRIEAARERQETFGLSGAEIGSDAPAMMKRLRPDIVFDCTDPDSHPVIASAALENGAHLLVEKPLTSSLEKAREMVNAAEKSGLSCAVMQNRRWSRGVVAFRQAVESGAVGPLNTLNADYYMALRLAGFRAEMKNVLLVDMAIHTLDQARFISGADPVSVYCHEWNPASAWHKNGISAIAIFEMNNGVVFRYQGSWFAQGMKTTWESSWRAIGDGGTITWDGADRIEGERMVRGRGEILIGETFQRPVPALPYEGHAALIRDFLDCLKSGEKPRTSFADNIRSLAMVQSAARSAESGRPVKVEW